MTLSRPVTVNNVLGNGIEGDKRTYKQLSVLVSAGMPCSTIVREVANPTMRDWGSLDTK